MDINEFSRQLEKRTKVFAIRTIKLSAKLPDSMEGMAVKNQIAISESSIGANYREANGARSKADLKNKIKIYENEASETPYWLEIIEESEWSSPVQTQSIITETGELQAIFTSIGAKLKSRQSNLQITPGT